VHFEELLKKSFPPGKKYVNMTNKVSNPGRRGESRDKYPHEILLKKQKEFLRY
jgi:hypothetical protein